MSQFHFDKLVTDLTRLDAPLTSGPSVRWRRSGLGSTTPGALSPKLNRSKAVTPGKSSSSRTPGKSKTPGKTPNKGLAQQNAARGRKTPSKTPNKGSQHDRFIPNRTTSDFELANFAIQKGEGESDEENGSPGKTEYQKQLGAAMDIPGNKKILSFKEHKPKPAEDHANNLQVVYSTSGRGSTNQTTTRVIPKVPERILDAPELLDDYYLNLLDWSSNNHLAVALGSSVYIWDAGSGSIVMLTGIDNVESPGEYMSSVRWIPQGSILAIGNSMGHVELWDVPSQKRMRSMTGHASRVGSLSWNSHVITSGSRLGAIHQHDVRVAEHCVGKLLHHTQDVCGLSWSPDGRYLASGGNDNVLNIWSNHLGDQTTPLHSLTHHQAAVKALSWCPWQGNILASGGGTADRQIRLWNVNTGACLNSVDAKSQVCAILWSKEHKELISGHGYSQNQLSIWKYPDLAKVTDLAGHKARVLNLAMSPDDSMVASAAADETVRIWNCFASDKVKKSSSAGIAKQGAALLKASHIR